MVLILPDFARRIDLPGAGPCPRPVDIDQARTGFASLVSLRVYAFAEGMVIHGDAEGDEVFVVAMRGRADIAVSGKDGPAPPVTLQAGGMRALYMPPHGSYRLTAITDCDVAYARVAGAGTVFPPSRAFGPAAQRLDVVDYAAGMALALVTAHAGAPLTFGQAGNSPERFVHIRSDDGAQATIAGQSLVDWGTVALAPGAPAVLVVETGCAEVLAISAAQPALAISKATIHA